MCKFHYICPSLGVLKRFRVTVDDNSAYKRNLIEIAILSRKSIVFTLIKIIRIESKNREMNLMNYIRKYCPNCGNEFVVLENVKRKDVYCTLQCLSEFHYKLKENEI